MRIAVAGGTGVVGRHVVRAAQERGHEVVVLSRAEGVDLVTGSGLDSRLDGVDALIDVTNTKQMNKAPAIRFFGAVTHTLLRAEENAGVRHHVMLSIVGIDRVHVGYYDAKLHQEELCLHAHVPATILRATQFHEFPAQILRLLPSFPVVPAPRMRSQTVAAREVAATLVDTAENEPAGRLPDLAGPEINEMPDLLRRFVRACQKRRLIVPIRVPGHVGHAIATGELLPTADGPRGHITFDDWLASDDARAWLT